MDMLVAEDVMLLLLDDTTGAIAGSSQIQVTLGGAVLVDLALRGAVAIEDKRGAMHVPKVTAVPGVGLEDPMLVEALAVVAEKPRGAQDLVYRLGKGAKQHVLGRLVNRGLVRAAEDSVLGVFSRAVWPAADVRYEAALRDGLGQVLGYSTPPNPHQGAVISVLHAVDQAHRVLHLPGMAPKELKRRAGIVAQGEWAAKAVRDAIATTNAVLVGIIAVGVVGTS